ncbi:VanZ family protein [Bradyrhizobium iriomotense]|uniref:VanZ family protein n=1 Tax=Bradyrhizobium iriomotense TaxID=441950 RepID=UPI001B89FC8F|nr:VanZ family protein [Bradyrhizobium iriomotense]MBR0784923.1 VanZ family protein [Bradyrhizobium iriomotense]
MLLKSSLENGAPAEAINRGASRGRIAFLRLVAWLLAVAVTVVTLGPQGVRPAPVLGQQGDHTLAFLLVGFLFARAYPQRSWTSLSVAVVLIGLLEIMQLWVPGRHARFEDFVVDALSALVGFALSAATDRMMVHLAKRPKR